MGLEEENSMFKNGSGVKAGESCSHSCVTSYEILGSYFLLILSNRARLKTDEWK